MAGSLAQGALRDTPGACLLSRPLDNSPRNYIFAQWVTAITACLIRIERLYLAVIYIYLVTLRSDDYSG